MSLAPSLDLRLKKVNKTYNENDVLSGTVVIQSKNEFSHQGIKLTVEGAVNMQLSSKNVGVFEAFYSSLKPVNLLNYTIDIIKPGKLPSGKTEIPFEVQLQSKGNKVLYETYHGVFVSIQYQVKVDMKRPLLAKDLSKQLEFIIECTNKEGVPKSNKVNFCITPDNIQNIKEKLSVPRFEVKGHLDSDNCIITEPLTGELIVQQSDSLLKSIELQLVRVETCGCAEGYSRDLTEIQNIQIAEGNVCRGIVIPIYMIFPRYFTCPSLETNNFKVEFEMNIVIIFQDDYLVTETFPLKLIRP